MKDSISIFSVLFCGQKMKTLIRIRKNLSMSRGSRLKSSRRFSTFFRRPFKSVLKLSDTKEIFRGILQKMKFQRMQGTFESRMKEEVDRLRVDRR
jgi:hypothetical protein